MDSSMQGFPVFHYLISFITTIIIKIIKFLLHTGLVEKKKMSKSQSLLLKSHFQGIAQMHRRLSNDPA